MLPGMPNVVFAVTSPARAIAVFADLTHEVIQLPLGISEVFVLVHVAGARSVVMQKEACSRAAAAPCDRRLEWLLSKAPWPA